MRDRRGGERDADAGAAAWRALNADVAPVEIDDLLEEGQPEAGARGLGGEEGQEDLLSVFRCDAAAGVGDLDDHALAGRAQGHDPLPALRAGPESLQRVLEHVGEDLAELLAVAERDGLALDVAVGHRNSLPSPPRPP